MPDAWNYPNELARYVRFLRGVLDARRISDAETVQLMDFENRTEQFREIDGEFQAEPLGSRRSVVVNELMVTTGELIAKLLNEDAIVLRSECVRSWPGQRASPPKDLRHHCAPVLGTTLIMLCVLTQEGRAVVPNCRLQCVDDLVATPLHAFHLGEKSTIH